MFVSISSSAGTKAWPPVRREEVEQFALAAANPFGSPEAFEVRQAGCW